MKKTILYITLLLLAAVATACAPQEDDIFTTARITVAAGDEIAISRIQAQVLLTNVNTRQTVTTADFQGPAATIELLRGAYQIGIEGVATCEMPDGQVRIRQFRCQSDYVEFASKDMNEITLNAIFLD
ncbi:MAG: hypothetical protein IKH25_08960 [Muribaculaceae bacterium]|nr:hypothetical protein [Muribaculaceae bacterium]